MAYTVIFKPKVERKIEKLPRDVRARIAAKANILSDNPRPPDMKKLAGKMEGLNRVRVGVYRIIYKIEDDELLILVVEIDHRKDIYR